MSDLAPEVGSIWRNIAMIFAAVVVTVFAADFLLRTICPPIPPKMEFSDGFSEFVSGKPNALVLGSSHARAYVALQKKSITIHVRAGPPQRAASGMGKVVVLSMGHRKPDRTLSGTGSLVGQPANFTIAASAPGHRMVGWVLP